MSDTGGTTKPREHESGQPMNDLFKAYVDDLGHVGTRYATANGFYLSVITALLALLALTEGGKSLDQVRSEVVLVVCVFAVIICWIWHGTIRFYGLLFKAKFAVLNAMDTQPPFKVYAEEYKLLKASGAGTLTTKEQMVPIALGVLFAVIGIIAAIRLYCTCCGLVV